MESEHRRDKSGAVNPGLGNVSADVRRTGNGLHITPAAQAITKSCECQLKGANLNSCPLKTAGARGLTTRPMETKLSAIMSRAMPRIGLCKWRQSPRTAEANKIVQHLHIGCGARDSLDVSDGRALTYVETRDGVSNIWGQPIEGGPPKQLTDFKSDLIFSFDWSRDGTLACARGTQNADVVLISGFR